MKLNVSNLLTTLAAVFFMALSAQAQEEMPILETQDPNPNHRELNLNEDKTLIYDRTSSHTTAVKDSIQSAPRVSPNHSNKAKMDAGKNNSKEAYDDALSFNFLYYMLQKFKLSDLIDQ
jgi:hypothetical protein